MLIMKKFITACGLFLSLIIFNTNPCEAKLYVEIRDHIWYDAETNSFKPSSRGWGQIIRIFNSNAVKKTYSSRKTITRELTLNINDASDLLFLTVTPKNQNEHALNKVIKVNKMTLSKEIAKYNLGVNSEIKIPEQLAKVEADNKDQIKISIKFTHPDKHD